jgi:hypothetical protein
VILLACNLRHSGKGLIHAASNIHPVVQTGNNGCLSSLWRDMVNGNFAEPPLQLFNPEQPLCMVSFAEFSFTNYHLPGLCEANSAGQQKGKD